MYDDDTAMSINDEKVVEGWEMTTCYKDMHYKMNIPFKEEKPMFPDNKKMAEARLQSLGKKLSRNPDLKQ